MSEVTRSGAGPRLTESGSTPVLTIEAAEILAIEIMSMTGKATESRGTYQLVDTLLSRWPDHAPDVELVFQLLGHSVLQVVLSPIGEELVVPDEDTVGVGCLYGYPAPDGSRQGQLDLEDGDYYDDP